MALYAFDGTWNEEKSSEDPDYTNTNVVRFRKAYERNTGVPQFYREGVGTRFAKVGQVLGGAFGLGERARIDEAYDALCQNWADGDTTIDIVGFSRGAATTLDFCHTLHGRGIRKPGTNEVVEANPTINFLGVWDVVAAFGLGNTGSEILNIGHHLELPRRHIRFAFHALALDERRIPFLPTRLPGACEVWFRGVHSDIGGGNGNRGLNDISLKWMFSKARAAGLPITDADIAELKPQVVTPRPATKRPVNVRAIASVDRQHYTVAPMGEWRIPPATCPVEGPPDEAAASEVGASGLLLMPPHVRARIAAMWEAAAAVAASHDISLTSTREWLLSLIEGRVLLVQSDADLVRAKKAMAVLVTRAVEKARRMHANSLDEFVLNQSLFELPHVFPITD